MPDIRAIAMDRASRLFEREEEEEVLQSSSRGGGDISLEDNPQGKVVYVSVGRGWRKGRVLSFDGDTYRVRTKREVMEVPLDRLISQEERNALKRSSQNTVIRR